MYDLWPPGTGKINLWGGVGLGLYQGHGNLTNHRVKLGKIQPFWGVFLAVFRLQWGYGIAGPFNEGKIDWWQLAWMGTRFGLLQRDFYYFKCLGITHFCTMQWWQNINLPEVNKLASVVPNKFLVDILIDLAPGWRVSNTFSAQSNL